MIEEFAAGERLAGRASRSSASTPALDTPTGGRDRAARGAPRRRAPSAPPTPTASPTSTSAPCSTSTASHGALATVTVVRPRSSSASPSSTTTAGSRGFDEKPRTEHWINGGFFCFEPGVARLPRRRQRARARAARAAGRRRPAARLPPRGLLGLHGHLQGRGRAQRPLGGGRGAVDGLGATAVEASREALAGHRRARLRRLALARALLERGDAVRSSTGRRATGGLAASALQGIDAEVELVEGDLRDAELVGAARRRRRLRRRLPPRGADDRRRRATVARRRPSRPTSRHLDAARGLPPRRGRRRSSSPPPTRPTGQPTSCPTARTSRCSRPPPTRRARPRPT